MLRVAVVLNGLVPLALLGWDIARGRLGANPIEFALRTTGTLCLVFLLLGLAVTPLRRLTGWARLVQARRALGLFAFLYGALHLGIYLWFEQALHLDAVVQDVFGRPFIAVGLLAFALMVPLAVTSTNGWIKRLGGKRWQRLHRRVYVIAALGVLHYVLLVKADRTRPYAFGGVLVVLLGARILPKRRRDAALRPRPADGARGAGSPPRTRPAG